MSNISVGSVDEVRMMSELRHMSGMAEGVKSSTIPNNGVNFSSVLADAIGKTNEIQQSSDQLKEAYELGDPNVSIAKVMVESQKANLSFQTLLQVRNKFLSAYKEIMNTQI